MDIHMFYYQSIIYFTQNGNSWLVCLYLIKNNDYEFDEQNEII